ncbi:MAG: sigma 54-interacting transcriptional regulator [Pseudomonadota bacterium]
MSVFKNGFKSTSIKTKLLVWLIPPIVAILAITGYISYRVTCHFINIAIERVIRVQTLAFAHEIERFLERCRQDLAFVAQNELDLAGMRNFLANTRRAGGVAYREFAYISQTGPSHIVLVAKDDEILQIPPEQISEVRPNPLLFYDQIKNLGKNDVWISNIVEVEHPFPSPSNPNRKISSRVIYLGIAYDRKGREPGYVILSVDVRTLRNILSVYNSPKSPIWAFPRSPEVRYLYFFDKDGWILFQSEDPDKPDKELTTDLARSGFTGTLGRPDLPSAFRPASVFGHFWKMVRDTHEGKRDVMKLRDEEYRSDIKEYYVSYAPVRFSPDKNAEPVIYGGVAYVDRVRLTLVAGYKQIDVMFVITLLTILVVSLLIFIFARFITRPIFELSRAVNTMREPDELEEIRLPRSGVETTVLQNAINTMIATMKRQLDEIRIRDKEIETVSLKEKATLEKEFPVHSTGSSGIEISGILGFGTKIEALKSDIWKAAQADVDVLIIGETGTGKQLAAEAIHHHSNRSGKPFISINCGELDENLLLDTLFGHVKGAFTEAKTDRKGAFLEANGGTLFLDEIQTASSAVQQSLLRAIAMRRIKPLGRDREISVDVRLIVATNADLKALIEQGVFRSDLYFRLKVITIYTPSLREQKENIAVLTRHYLKQAAIMASKGELGLSRGALEKMKQYDWPGNVRELMNCIIRAVVMAEGNVIQAEAIKLESEAPGRGMTHPAASDEPGAGFPAVVRDNGAGVVFSRQPLPKTPLIPNNYRGKMNPRQEKAYPSIVQRGWISRSEYQEIVGGDLSPRTAIYDLQDLVKKGLLKKVGQGPATRYVPVLEGLDA